MKKAAQIAIFIISILFITFFIQQPSLAQTIHIEANDLLVRSGPGTTHELIGHVDEGETYPMVDEEDDWFAINYDGTTGWVSKQYASKRDQQDVDTDNESDADPNQPDTEEDTSYNDTPFSIPVGQVHLRSEATTQSDILTVLTKGEQVTIISKSSQWMKIQTKDFEGFIPAWLIVYREPADPQEQSLYNKVILLDPGHGGYDVGAISIADEYEKNYTLKTAQILKKKLEQQGADVYITRNDDNHYSLIPRATYANFLGADVFLSLHYNSEPQYPSANGINTYYYKQADRELADYVHQELIDETNANDREVTTANYLVLRVSKQPSLLVELGFLSNKAEEQTIQSIAYQNKLSQGIVNGLQAYFKNKTP